MVYVFCSFYEKNNVYSFKTIHMCAVPQNEQKTYIYNLLKFYNDPTNTKEMAKLQSLKSDKEHS